MIYRFGVFSVVILVALFGLAELAQAGCICDGREEDSYTQAQCDTLPACAWESTGSPAESTGTSGESTGNSAESTGEPARPTIDRSYADLINPLTGKADKGDPYALFTTVVANLIRAILGLSGAFAMLGFVWGGVTWMTSYGNDQKITRGRQMMVWSGFGLIVLLSSYAVVSYLFGALGFV